MTPEEIKAKADANYAALEKKLESAHPKLKSDFVHIPKTYRRLFLDVHCGDKTSYTKQIRLKCLDCSCWDKNEITHCAVRQCGLWKSRPYQEKEK
jgi:glucose-6-phosphate 1-dehydrogenase